MVCSLINVNQFQVANVSWSKMSSEINKTGTLYNANYLLLEERQ